MVMWGGFQAVIVLLCSGVLYVIWNIRRATLPYAALRGSNEVKTDTCAKESCVSLMERRNSRTRMQLRLSQRGYTDIPDARNEEIEAIPQFFLVLLTERVHGGM